MKINTKEEIREITNSRNDSFLRGYDVVKVGSSKRYEITPNDTGVEVTEWNVTKYYYKDGHTEEALGGCTIDIEKSVRKRVTKAIGEYE